MKVWCVSTAILAPLCPATPAYPRLSGPQQRVHSSVPSVPLPRGGSRAEPWLSSQGIPSTSRWTRAVLPHPAGHSSGARVSLHSWTHCSNSRSLQLSSLCPSTAQSSVDCRTQQCTRTKAAAQLMQPPMALGRADLLYW